MERIKDDFLASLEKHVPLANKVVVEFGCGKGAYSKKIAARCRILTGIDPDRQAIHEANGLKIPNAKFLYVASPHNSGLTKAHFDVTIFTNSFHHAFVPMMPRTIDEAVRVTKPEGFIVFLEPGEKGSFFEAEIRFNACDGDETGVKQAARRIMTAHPKLEPVVEIPDETQFRFKDANDFMIEMKPTHLNERLKNMHELEKFLSSRNFVLSAERRINIFKPRT